MATSEQELLSAAASSAGLDLNYVSVESILGGKSGSHVFRMRTADQEPMILKILDANKLPDYLLQSYPRIAEAEWRFYTELAPKLDLPGPRIFAAGRLPQATSFLLMEDLTVRHRIPSEDHRWLDEELRSILAAYAHLHSRSMQLFARDGVPDWLNPDPRSEYNPDQVMGCLESFSANSWTKALVDPIVRSVQVERLVRSVADSLDDLPTGILYNDFYPCNVAIPQSSGPAVIFDWQLVGSGPLPIDLVNIGLLGHFEAFTRINAHALLEFYLDQLGEETGMRPKTKIFRENCRWASLLAWGVFMPRMVRAMQRANQQGQQYSAWMDGLYRTCMAEWAEALKCG